MKAPEKQDNDDAENVIMSISLPKEMKKKIRLYAVENDMNVSMVIRRIFRESPPEYGLCDKKEDKE